MASKPQPRFTGKHMAAILVTGFGIVAAVNFTMASYATNGFHGVVVENSYVASQKFNGWLEEAEAERALGWEAKPTREADGHIALATSGLPEGAQITAALRRPLGAHEFTDLTFERTEDGRYRSTEAVAAGRWTMRLHIEAEGHKWAEESDL